MNVRANYLQGYPVTYSPDKGDFKLLFNCTLRKKLVDLADFKKIHGLAKKPFLDKRNSRITFTVTSQEQAEAAITYVFFSFSLSRFLAPLSPAAFSLFEYRAMIEVIAALKQTNLAEVEEEEEESSSDDEFGMDNDGLFAPSFMTHQFPSSSSSPFPSSMFASQPFMGGGGMLRAMQMHQQRRPQQQQTNIFAELFNLLSR